MVSVNAVIVSSTIVHNWNQIIWKKPQIVNPLVNRVCEHIHIYWYIRTDSTDPVAPYFSPTIERQELAIVIWKRDFQPCLGFLNQPLVGGLTHNN